jgi:anti-sigma B factor antagonist
MLHPHTTEDELLDINIDFADTGMYISLKGEMDVSNSDRLRPTVASSHTVDTQHAIVDLSGLTFCDASGLAQLVAVHTHLTSAACEITVSGVRPHLLRILRITGVDQVLLPAQRVSGVA